MDLQNTNFILRQRVINGPNTIIKLKMLAGQESLTL